MSKPQTTPDKMTVDTLDQFDFVKHVNDLALIVPVKNETGNMNGSVYILTGEGLFGLANRIANHVEQHVIKQMRKYTEAA